MYYLKFDKTGLTLIWFSGPEMLWSGICEQRFLAVYIGIGSPTFWISSFCRDQADKASSSWIAWHLKIDQTHVPKRP